MASVGFPQDLRVMGDEFSEGKTPFSPLEDLKGSLERAISWSFSHTGSFMLSYSLGEKKLTISREE